MRFPIEFLHFQGKSICRSSTLSKGIEVIYNQRSTPFNFLTKVFSSQDLDPDSVEMTYQKELILSQVRKSRKAKHNEGTLPESRLVDIELLKQIWQVKYIVDFMVEDKKEKYGLIVSSSEKSDTFGRYNKFSINSLPYPGVEIFEEFKVNDYDASGIVFNWDKRDRDAILSIDPELLELPVLKRIQWGEYTHWDLNEITQNYLVACLCMIADPREKSGLDIHCLSGWDRTPFFASLIRLSLWADDEIHQNLNESEILYLTIAYDWCLFKHMLKTRVKEKYEIMRFEFYFLQFILDNGFSIKNYQNEWKLKLNSSNNKETLLKNKIKLNIENCTTKKNNNKGKSKSKSKNEIQSKHRNGDKLRCSRLIKVSNLFNDLYLNYILKKKKK